jgi:hypothetical protein
MRTLARLVIATAITAITLIGAGPSCTTSGSGYQTSIRYSDPYRPSSFGTGPSYGCQRIPAPSQC